ncbi:hypothetical protein Tsp_11130 [Trichinella spiralis]|uniref:hypothetical protein n=1 Tax=Trichinella spiralis TaxID=6334 RepID=UPI0001EFEAD9|nr:hypothetical protein Tsp_11130 [Trichinella spiralis]
MARMRAEEFNGYLKRVDPIPSPTHQRILTAFSQRISLAAALIHASKFHKNEIWGSLMNLHSDLLAQNWRSMGDCAQYSGKLNVLINRNRRRTVILAKVSVAMYKFTDLQSAGQFHRL